jgi:hypothetical protein
MQSKKLSVIYCLMFLIKRGMTTAVKRSNFEWENEEKE